MKTFQDITDFGAGQAWECHSETRLVASCRRDRCSSNSVSGSTFYDDVRLECKFPSDACQEPGHFHLCFLFEPVSVFLYRSPAVGVRMCTGATRRADRETPRDTERRAPAINTFVCSGTEHRLPRRYWESAHEHCPPMFAPNSASEDFGHGGPPNTEPLEFVGVSPALPTSNSAIVLRLGPRGI